MSNSVGLYIHIPFCRSKCPYCDFFSVRKNTQAEFDNYIKLLVDKILYWAQKVNEVVDTIYIGGGTPSVIGAENICKILDTIKENFNVTDDCEITMEVNPATGKFFDFNLVAKHGINRVSIGLQSANENELKALGRLHNVDDVNNTLELVRKAGIINISLDLMMGISQQTKESLKNSINFCVNKNVTHISSYILSIEENTHFYKIKDELDLPDDDIISELYLYAVDYLKKKGYNQYEISNFSKSGFESNHNTRYWKLKDYIGIGPSAHSCYNGKRFYYPLSFDDFEKNIIVDDGVGGTEEEFIMLGLRLCQGININEYEKTFGKEISKGFLDKVIKYQNLGLMEIQNDCIRFTPHGFLLSNSILSDLI